jgi:hypothetical protein
MNNVRLATARVADNFGTAVVIVDPERGVARVTDLIPGFTGDVPTLLGSATLAALSELAGSAPDRVFRDTADVDFVAPYRRPRKIWGIGAQLRGPCQRPGRDGSHGAGLVHERRSHHHRAR